ncbi:MAG: hypothetical protein FGM57_02900 [Candidatus Taylorbacteria bacterium]|nr:hypothetical protein [Candidatus Taylorbacteria bacterium]
MKNNIMPKIGIVLCAIITLVLSSCTTQPRRVYVPDQMMGGSPPQSHVMREFTGDANGSTADAQRREAFKGYAKIVKTEKLAPIQAVPESLQSVISNGRFRRDSDGVLSYEVTKVVVSGGLIGWSGSYFGFEPQFEKEIGFHDRITISDMVNACYKHQRLPYSSKPHWARIREGVMSRAAQSGRPFRS